MDNNNLSVNKNFLQAEPSFVRVRDENVRFHDVDFWLVFEKKLIKSSTESFVEDLKNQFESINIVKIKQYFYFEKGNKSTPFKASFLSQLL
ncbi:MAG: hypothetical protein EOO43_16935 [Flavobacterium sp.]|nr:MAG: hypothetical protein EOO43_16935 [Flavobacterium sp.]